MIQFSERQMEPMANADCTTGENETSPSTSVVLIFETEIISINYGSLFLEMYTMAPGGPKTIF